MNRVKIIGGLIGVIMFLVCLTGVTYAFFTWRNEEEEDVPVEFKINDTSNKYIYELINEENNTNTINIKLTKDNNYEKNIDFNLYKKNNTTNIVSNISITINNLNNIINKDIKWVLYKDNKVLKLGDFTNILNNKIDIYNNLDLTSEKTKYTIKFYIENKELASDENIEIDNNIIKITSN